MVRGFLSVLHRSHRPATPAVPPDRNDKLLLWRTNPSNRSFSAWEKIPSKRFVAVALLLASLSTPVFAAVRRDEGNQPSQSVISRLIHRVVQALDDWSWPKP
jgi:hypothetical protein